MNIKIGNANYITPDNADDYTIVEMMKVNLDEDEDEDEDFDDWDKTTFIIAADENKDTGDADGFFEKFISFYPDEDDRTKDTVFMEVQFKKSNSRKYYEELVDVGILHDAIKTTSLKGKTGIVGPIEFKQDHDEPYYYHSSLIFSMKVNIHDSVELLITKIKSIEVELFFSVFNLAAYNQKNAINAYLAYIEELKNESN